MIVYIQILGLFILTEPKTVKSTLEVFTVSRTSNYLIFSIQFSLFK